MKALFSWTSMIWLRTSISRLAFAPRAWLWAVHHGGIEGFAAKVDAMLHAAGQLYRHVRVQFFPLQQLGQQPAQHAGGGFDLQRGAANAGVLDGLADQVERLLDARVQRLALFGQAQSTGLAMEQQVTQLILKPGNLPAYRTLGDAQLLGSTGEVAALGRDYKSVQRRKWR